LLEEVVEVDLVELTAGLELMELQILAAAAAAR
jgi:hypothetical protein